MRPYVNLKSENEINDFISALESNIKNFESLEGVTMPAYQLYQKNLF